MAYRKPQDLDGYIQIMPKADMRVKTALAEDLVTFLSDENNSTVCADMGLLVDNLIPWLTGSHFKIAQKSLEAFSELIKRLGPDFNAYTATVLPHVTDRLGDSKDTVREKAQLLIQNFMEYKVLSPQVTIDKMAASCFKHKNAKVREEFLQTIVNTLNEYGTSQLSVRNYIHPISSLLGDPTATVRDAAIQTLVEIYKHVGDRLRADLRKMEDVSSAKLAILEQKFDQVKNEGLLLKSASVNPNNNNNNNGQDENDCASSIRERPTRIVKRVPSAGPRIKSNSSDLIGLAADAGAITVENFEASFEAVPQLTIFHPKDKEDIYKTVVAIISDKNADWEKKVDSLKRIRSLILLNIQSQPQFPAQLKDLSIYFLDILKEELRSQVIREACITIAYMSKVLGNKLDQFAIYILEQLINLIQNSARVIASSSTIALKYIVRYTHAPKLVKIITDTLQTSKSKDIRANLSEILCLVLAEWQTKSLERYNIQLKNTLKKSISDADNEARRHSRRAYWMFRKHFPELADQIYIGLDVTTQKALERERDSTGGSEEVRSIPTAMRFQRSSYVLQKPVGIRSVSAVDAAAAQRAKARSLYALSAKKKPYITPGASSNVSSLPRSKQLENTMIPCQTSQTLSSRTRGRAGVSQSQPSSRSTSPSSKLREQQSFYRPLTGTVPKKASGIPRSLANSRETSPTRSSMKRSMYTAGVSNMRRSSERSTPARPLATARLLQQSREAENSLNDVPSPEGIDKSDYSINDYSRVRLGRRLLSRDESDDSEASSVCSERSNDSSFTRNMANYSLSGSRNRLDWSSTRGTYNIDIIIQCCASAHWSERKDGLINLTQYLADGKILTPEQLQAVLDMFRKMFMDTHAKVYSLFLDTVTELILVHANDLHDWLFILLTRLFNKLGTELLNSMHSKIWKTLQVIHEYFPIDLQMKDVLRILCDTAQTPCTKTKIAILKFLTNLATTYCKNTDFPIEDGLPSLEKAVLKIVQLSGDHKSTELRGQARLCLIALYNCNTPLLTKLLSNLPKGYQDSARTIIKAHLRRSSTSGTNSPSSSPLSSSSPKPLQSPSLASYSSMQHQINTSLPVQSSVEEEFYAEADVQHNIHKTSEEIRNCFGNEAPLTRQYHSLSIASNGHNGHVNDQHDSCTSSNSKTQSNTTTESNTPENNTRCFEVSLLEQVPNDFSKANNRSMTVDSATSSTLTASTHHSSFKELIKYDVAPNGEIELDNGLRESEIIKRACALTTSLPPEEISETLCKLGVCIKSGNCELPNKNFRAIMKMLLNLLSAQSSEIVVDALYILSKIVRSEKMKPNWDKFLELILLKIIGCYQISKETAREIDAIIPRIVPVLPVDVTINIVNPVIATGSYPLNLCAVKLLTELIGRQSAEFTETHLDNVFPNLARLTDDVQSMVRKAAVFCIVKLYMIMGEDKIKPKLSLLNPSKVRLLNVYIDKQRNATSGGGGGSFIKISSVS